MYFKVDGEEETKPVATWKNARLFLLFLKLIFISCCLLPLHFQAMNFFAGLLLLMMPEENAFW